MISITVSLKDSFGTMLSGSDGKRLHEMLTSGMFSHVTIDFTGVNGITDEFIEYGFTNLPDDVGIGFSNVEVHTIQRIYKEVEDGA